jgi:hypothetical protein
VLLAAAPAQAADWRLTGVTLRGSTYVDAESVNRSGDRVEYLETMIFLDAPRGMTRSLARQRADCRSFELSTLEMTAFLTDGRSDTWRPSGEPLTAPPGSVFHASITAACSREWPGETVADPVADAMSRRGGGKN